MPKRSCPKCSRRLPYAARRCLNCQWSLADGEVLLGRSFWSRGRVWSLIVLVAGVMGGSTAYRNADTIAFWYANFAARHLPSSLLSVAPAESDAGAFFYCARQVSRRMDGDFSVETFPSLDQSSAVRLGDGRYRIQSFVDEVRADGERRRHSFVCTVHYDRGRWVLDGLDLRTGYADASR